MSLYDIAERLMERKEKRLRIGWVDWSSDSWDRRECERRAWRILQRACGIHTNRKGEPL
jgi:hypothetical protein